MKEITMTMAEYREYEAAVAAPSDDALARHRAGRAKAALARYLEAAGLGPAASADRHWGHLWPQCHRAGQALWESGDPLAAAESMAAEAARIRGWLEAAATQLPPSVMTLVWGSIQVSPWCDSQAGVPRLAPHAVARWWRAVGARAAQVLAPYGWAPSRRALVAAMRLVAASNCHHLPAVGRTAYRVAAASLPAAFGGGITDGGTPGMPWHTPPSLPSRRQAMAALIAARGWAGLRDESSAVQAAAMAVVRAGGATLTEAIAEARVALVDTTPPDEAGVVAGRRVLYRRAGCAVHRGWRYGLPARDQEGRHIYVVTGPGGRRYHAADCWSRRYLADAIRDAVRAWRWQAAADAEQAAQAETLAGLLDRPDGAVTVVWAKDSLATGNCLPGTAHWAAQHGYGGCAPLAAVAADPDPAARRVVARVVREVTA